MLALTFVGLFLFAQGLAQAHAVEFGTDHDHDGVACMVSVLGEDDDALPAPLETRTADIEEAPAPVLLPTKVIGFTTAYPCRAPPPRAPPR